MPKAQSIQAPEDMVVPVPDGTIDPKVGPTTHIDIVKGKKVLVISGHIPEVAAAAKADAQVKTGQKDMELYKISFRQLVRDELTKLESAGITDVHAAHIEGANVIVEVVPSRKRKSVNDGLYSSATTCGLQHLFAEETAVTLTGSMAEWFMKLFGTMPGPNPDISIEKKRVLSPSFEDYKRNRLLNGCPDFERQLLESAQTEGLYASAVEVKVKK